MSDERRSVSVSVGSQAGGRPPGDEEPRPGAPSDGRPRITPPIDIHDGPEGLTLEADLPGATASSLTIQLEHNVLTLDAKVASPFPDSMRLVHQEYPLGDYHRSFILSDDIDRDRITAELKDGVLTIFLPKADRARARRVRISS